MRRALLLFCVAVAVPAVSQERGGRVYRMPAEWEMALPAFEKRVQATTAGIKTQAFIVGQVTLALGDLTDDMQILSAMQKALDRIKEAQAKAGDPYGSRTAVALMKMHDALENGRRQGTMADVEGIRRVLLKEGETIQSDLFRALKTARGDRQNLVDLLNRIQVMNSDLEGAMVDALGSTFDFMAAGGR